MTGPVLSVQTEVDATDTPLRRSLWVWCPGCADVHRVVIALPDGSNLSTYGLWTWDGDETAPTIEPSILVRGGRQGSDHTCHSFLRSGVWQFLGDCSHALAGQQVPMVPLPDWLTAEHGRG